MEMPAGMSRRHNVEVEMTVDHLALLKILAILELIIKALVILLRH
jgi:hypothetical protein